MKHIQHFSNQLRYSLENNWLKKIIIYLFIISSLGNTFYVITLKYAYSTSQLFFNTSLPHFKSEIGQGFFIKNYIYQYTNIMLDQPFTFLTHTMPYLKTYDYLIGMNTKEINGYFDGNNTEEISDVEEENYAPELPLVRKIAIDKNNYKDPYYLLKYFITGDASLEIDTNFLRQWDFYKLMTKNIRINTKSEGPKVLIFHTHAREKYKDGISVVDVGESLKETLENKYDLETLHITDEFYMDDSGSTARCYEIMEETIQKVLKEYPSIEIAIDLHRDGVPDNVHLIHSINNKDTAKIMFVNGLCRNRNVDGEIVHMKELTNPYLEDNLAFSLQAQEMAYQYYPGLMKKVYFKEYRYSLHMRPLSLLVEIGAQTNSGQEAFNAIEPLANIITKVVEKD